MGFPKPWPTDWPEPDHQVPEDDPQRKDEPDEDEEEPPTEIPEFTSVTWAINHPCNLRCTHCYDVTAERRQDLSTADALTVVGRLAAAGVRFIAFSGGEAFLRKDVFDLMSEARRCGIGIAARSNGTLITPVVARRLRELDIQVVGVSFDGATADTHDAVRGHGAFDAALAGLVALRAEGIRAQMEVVLSRQNLHEAIACVELGERVGASEVNFSAMTPQGRGKLREADLLDHGLWLRLTRVLQAASAGARIAVSPNCALTGTCVATIEPHVTCEGWMTACYLSAVPLFHVLRTAPEAFRERLAAARGESQDVCGRRRWTRACAKWALPLV